MPNEKSTAGELEFVELVNLFDRVYWRRYFKISDEDLRDAVAAAGPKREDVEAYLRSARRHNPPAAKAA